MDIPLEEETPEFLGSNLALRPASWFRGPRLLLNDEVVKGHFGRYLIRGRDGKEVSVRLVSNYIDPIPKIKINDQTLSIARSLKWYEYVWSGLSILLLFYGGFLGAICGFVALQRNAAVFRSKSNEVMKFCFTGLISHGALAAYFLLAAIIFAILKHPGP